MAICFQRLCGIILGHLIYLVLLGLPVFPSSADWWMGEQKGYHKVRLWGVLSGRMEGYAGMPLLMPLTALVPLVGKGKEFFLPMRIKRFLRSRYLLLTRFLFPGLPIYSAATSGEGSLQALWDKCASQAGLLSAFIKVIILVLILVLRYTLGNTKFIYCKHLKITFVRL